LKLQTLLDVRQKPLIAVTTPVLYVHCVLFDEHVILQRVQPLVMKEFPAAIVSSRGV